MKLDLQDKVAVVTGGSRGIGLATVRVLIDEGMKVMTASRRVTEELSETSAVPFTVDLTTEDGPKRLIDEAVSHFGGIDVLVNNVGVGDTDDVIRGATQDLATLSDEAWRHTFDLHFYTALRATRAALPSLLERKGVVVNVSSAGARIVSAGPADYNVAKAALNALTANLRGDLRASHPAIHVSLVMPGLVSTDFARNARGGGRTQAPPSGAMRPQSPEEVAASSAALIAEPVAEIYTNPASAAIVRRYYEDVEAFERGT